MLRWNFCGAVTLVLVSVQVAAADPTPPAHSSIRVGWRYADPPMIVRNTAGSDVASFSASMPVNEWQIGSFTRFTHSQVGNGSASVSITGSMSIMDGAVGLAPWWPLP